MKLKRYDQYLLLGASLVALALLSGACSPAQGKANLSEPSQVQPAGGREGGESQDGAKDEPIDTQRDYSNFNTFEYQRVHEEECNLAYYEQGVQEATIRRRSNGEMTFEFLWFEETTGDIDNCPAEMQVATTAGVACLKPVQPPQRTLTDDESAQVLETFGEVMITIYPDRYEGPVCEQACEWDLYGWDSENHALGTCACYDGDGCMDYQKGEEIDALLAGLAAASLMPEEATEPPE